ncbi:MAG: ArsI/CadI family heavy metal resistance metalloenzyme [Bdellovibrionota bacterium]
MRTHVSIDVENVSKSVEFYEKVFGAAPQKQTADYAKFDLADPSLNFSMQKRENGSISKVNHFGIEVESEAAVREWEQKLSAAGIQSSAEDKTDCCYALQDKIWFSDPDGNAWEVFVVHAQLGTEDRSKKTTIGRPEQVASKSSCCR